jgi:hypothetical protein
MDEKKILEILRVAQGTCLAFASAAAKSGSVEFKYQAFVQMRDAMQSAANKMDVLLDKYEAERKAAGLA